MITLAHFNLLTTTQLADIFGLSEDTLRRWRAKGRGPAFIRIGQSIFYSVPAVAEWVGSHGEIGGEGRVVSGGYESETTSTLSEANPYSNFARAPTGANG